MADFETEVKNLGNTADYTAQFNPQDIQANKVMAILAYFGPLVLIPLLAAKTSPFARFHSNQGLLLLALSVALNLVSIILGGIPIIGWIIAIFVWILTIGVFVLFILGVVNAGSGKAKDLPLIGKIRILK